MKICLPCALNVSVVSSAREIPIDLILWNPRGIADRISMGHIERTYTMKHDSEKMMDVNS